MSSELCTRPRSMRTRIIILLFSGIWENWKLLTGERMTILFSIWLTIWQQNLTLEQWESWSPTLGTTKGCPKRLRKLLKFWLEKCLSHIYTFGGSAIWTMASAASLYAANGYDNATNGSAYASTEGFSNAAEKQWSALFHLPNAWACTENVSLCTTYAECWKRSWWGKIWK